MFRLHPTCQPVCRTLSLAPTRSREHAKTRTVSLFFCLYITVSLCLSLSLSVSLRLSVSVSVSVTLLPSKKHTAVLHDLSTPSLLHVARTPNYNIFHRVWVLRRWKHHVTTFREHQTAEARRKTSCLKRFLVKKYG